MALLNASPVEIIALFDGLFKIFKLFPGTSSYIPATLLFEPEVTGFNSCPA